jgi:hypothetical protein
VILTAQKSGLTDFYVVPGYNGEEVRGDILTKLKQRTDLALTETENFSRERSIAIKWGIGRDLWIFHTMNRST